MNNRQAIKSKIFKIITTFIIMIISCNSLFAQPIPEPIDIPIDGGISYLLAAGIIYGAKKYYSNRKSKKVSE